MSFFCLVTPDSPTKSKNKTWLWGNEEITFRNRIVSICKNYLRIRSKIKPQEFGLKPGIFQLEREANYNEQTNTSVSNVHENQVWVLDKARIYIPSPKSLTPASSTLSYIATSFQQAFARITFAGFCSLCGFGSEIMGCLCLGIAGFFCLGATGCFRVGNPDSFHQIASALDLWTP